MNKKKGLWTLMSLLLLSSMILAACASSATLSGRVRFHASGNSPMGKPRTCNSVPQAPSVTTGPRATSCWMTSCMP